MAGTSAIDDPTRCPHCGLIHATTCPRIKSIEYENGMVKRIEFHPTSSASDYMVGPGTWREAWRG